jgi:hypothetical protein
MQSVLLNVQEYQSLQERLTASRERFARYNTPFPIEKAVDHVLSDQTTFNQAHLAATRAAVQLASRVVREAGYRHSAPAAVAVLQWCRSRYGSDVDTALYDACISACTINFAPEAALKVFSEMDADGKHASIRTLNMLIGSCVAAGFVDIALEVCPFQSSALDTSKSQATQRLR